MRTPFFIPPLWVGLVSGGGGTQIDFTRSFEAEIQRRLRLSRHNSAEIFNVHKATGAAGTGVFSAVFAKFPVCQRQSRVVLFCRLSWSIHSIFFPSTSPPSYLPFPAVPRRNALGQFKIEGFDGIYGFSTHVFLLHFARRMFGLIFSYGFSRASERAQRF